MCLTVICRPAGACGKLLPDWKAPVPGLTESGDCSSMRRPSLDLLTCYMTTWLTQDRGLAWMNVELRALQPLVQSQYLQRV